MSTSFESKCFATGRFRNAYKGTWLSPRERRGQKCVVKENKDTYTWDKTGWDTTVKIVKKAQELAEEFNRLNNFRRPIEFEDIHVHVVTNTNNKYGHPKLDEYVTVENYIAGDFTKWCNNYGFISSEAASTAITMPAFMHWSWVYTKGELMIADLQGVRDVDCYSLTDPVIMSLRGDYGATDTGVEGMVMFFLNHECNDFCKHLPRPTAHDFLTHPLLPRAQVQACFQMASDMYNSTTYKCELKLSLETKIILSQILKTYF